MIRRQYSNIEVDNEISGSVLVSIGEVNLRRARLVLGWVTVSGFNSRCGILLCSDATSHPGQLSVAILASVVCVWVVDNTV